MLWELRMSEQEQQLRILGSPRAAETLAALHRQATRHEWRTIGLFAPFAVHLLLGRRLPWQRVQPKLATHPLAVDVQSGIFAYQLARALRAQQIIEFGTSHGLSTIYFALAVRQNGGGRVIATELIAEKAERARENFERAGVADVIDLRIGDATETLRNVDGPVDMLFNDGFPDAMLPVTQLVAPNLRPGAVVMAGNVALFPTDHQEYVEWMREPRNGFASTRMPMTMGGEFSVKVAQP